MLSCRQHHPNEPSATLRRDVGKLSLPAVFLSALFAVPLLQGPVLGQTADTANPQQDGWSMKIRIVFHDQDYTAALYNNVSARDFASMLPLHLTIKDISNNKKIAYLPCRLNDEPGGRSRTRLLATFATTSRGQLGLLLRRLREHTGSRTARPIGWRHPAAAHTRGIPAAYRGSAIA